MSEPRHRKLTAMGIASLVSTGRHEVLERLPTEICNLWLDVFGEIRETATASDELSLHFDDSKKFLAADCAAALLNRRCSCIGIHRLRHSTATLRKLRNTTAEKLYVYPLSQR